MRFRHDQEGDFGRIRRQQQVIQTLAERVKNPTVLLKAEFANRDNTLWPGEFLNVRLQLYVQDKALVVPAQAVMTGQQGTYVFLVNQDGTARSQPVTVARTAGQYAILAQGGGVQPGDQVVTDGQLRLVSGAPVEVKGGVSGAGGDVEADK